MGPLRGTCFALCLLLGKGRREDGELEDRWKLFEKLKDRRLGAITCAKVGKVIKKCGDVSEDGRKGEAMILCSMFWKVKKTHYDDDGTIEQSCHLGV